MTLTHVGPGGEARMVDIGGKAVSRRTALASGRVRLAPATLELIRTNQVAKGDVLSAARLAGIMAGKKTAELIPLCHNIPIEKIEVRLTLQADGVFIESEAACEAKTGIEMEALTAVAGAALTVYDMCKAVDKTMSIEDIKLIRKTKDAVHD
jgi:molybdenum cofactor biosynthesis protein MoaC